MSDCPQEPSSSGGFYNIPLLLSYSQPVVHMLPFFALAEVSGRKFNEGPHNFSQINLHEVPCRNIAQVADQVICNRPIHLQTQQIAFLDNLSFLSLRFKSTTTATEHFFFFFHWTSQAQASVFLQRKAIFALDRYSYIFSFCIKKCIEKYEQINAINLFICIISGLMSKCFLS